MFASYIHKLWAKATGLPRLVKVLIPIALIVLIAGVYFAWPRSNEPACRDNECKKVATPGDATPPPKAPSEDKQPDKKSGKKTDTKPPRSTPTPPVSRTPGSPSTGGGGGATPSPAPGGGTPGVQSCAPFPAFPDESCTGVPSGIQMQTISGGFSTTGNGQTISGKLITGELVVDHNNVTVVNSRIKGALSTAVLG